MVKYRNVRHGRVVIRAREDKWLEASAGWERIEDVPPPQVSDADDKDEGSND